MGIILKHGLPRICLILYTSFFYFDFQLIIFFLFCKIHQKWYKNGFVFKNGQLEKNYTKCSKLIFICSIHKHTWQFQHLSTLCEPTGDILYIVSTFRRVRWISRIHQKYAQNVFFFGEPFQWRFPSQHLHRSRLCFTHRSRCFCFSIFVLYFSSVFVFCIVVRFVRSEQKENIQITREILNDKSMCHQEVYSKCYLRGERQPMRMLFFEKRTRKITAEFQKVTPVKPFIDCLISYHTILTWNNGKLAHTF